MSELQGLLEALSDLLRNLVATLALEGEALQRGEVDTLPELTATKERHARALAGGWAALTDALRLAPPITRQAIEAAISNHTELGLSESWSRIVGLIDETRRLNRRNARLIEEQLRRTRVALDILQSAASLQAIYGADGHSVDLFSPLRSIDEA